MLELPTSRAMLGPLVIFSIADLSKFSFASSGVTTTPCHLQLGFVFNLSLKKGPRDSRSASRKFKINLLLKLDQWRNYKFGGPTAKAAKHS